MKTHCIAFIIWAVALAASIASIFVFASALPEQVAVHFNFSGTADRWGSRSEHVIFFALLDAFMAGFLPALCYAFRFFPSGALNVPNPDYWRSPEHYPQACEFLFRHAFWFGALMAIWSGLLDLLVVRANLATPPHLSLLEVVWLTVALFAGVGIWTLPLLRFFRGVPTLDASR